MLTTSSYHPDFLLLYHSFISLSLYFLTQYLKRVDYHLSALFLNFLLSYHTSRKPHLLTIHLSYSIKNRTFLIICSSKNISDSQFIKLGFIVYLYPFHSFYFFCPANTFYSKKYQPMNSLHLKEAQQSKLKAKNHSLQNPPQISIFSVLQAGI